MTNKSEKHTSKTHQLEENTPANDVRKESKLVWKDASELPENHCVILAKFCNDNLIICESYDGRIFLNGEEADEKAIVKCTTLTDLINSIESMLSKQDELEERIKRLENDNNNN